MVALHCVFYCQRDPDYGGGLPACGWRTVRGIGFSLPDIHVVKPGAGEI